MLNNDRPLKVVRLSDHYLSQYEPRAVRSEAEFAQSIAKKNTEIAHLRRSQSTNFLERATQKLFESIREAS